MLQPLITPTLLKRHSNTVFFPEKFAKFLRTPYFRDHLQLLLQTVSGFQTATLLKKRFRQKKAPDAFLLILQNFPEYLSIEHLRMTFVSCVYLRILRSL